MDFACSASLTKIYWPNEICMKWLLHFAIKESLFESESHETASTPATHTVSYTLHSTEYRAHKNIMMYIALVIYRVHFCFISFNFFFFHPQSCTRWSYKCSKSTKYKEHAVHCTLYNHETKSNIMIKNCFIVGSHNERKKKKQKETEMYC